MAIIILKKEIIQNVLKPGEITHAWGFSGVGKTIFLLNIILNFLSSPEHYNHKIIYLSSNPKDLLRKIGNMKIQWKKHPDIKEIIEKNLIIIKFIESNNMKNPIFTFPFMFKPALDEETLLEIKKLQEKNILDISDSTCATIKASNLAEPRLIIIDEFINHSNPIIQSSAQEDNVYINSNTNSSFKVNTSESIGLLLGLMKTIIKKHEIPLIISTSAHMAFNDANDKIPGKKREEPMMQAMLRFYVDISIHLSKTNQPGQIKMVLTRQSTPHLIYDTFISQKDLYSFKL
ncbi:MAG: hypothetical protein ACTSVI_07620 [Promethearchaeota archaeon]